MTVPTPARAPLPRTETTTVPSTVPSTGPLSRRALLSGVGAGAAGLLLAACGGDGTDAGSSATAPATGAPTAQDGADAVQQSLAAAGVDAPVELTVIVANFETLTGEGRRLQFGLLDENREPALDQDLEAHLVRTGDGTDVTGAVTPTFYGEGLGARGIYSFQADLTDPGLYDLVVVRADGSQAGTAAFQVITPEQSVVPVPGAAFPSVDTPTYEDPQGLAELCTRNPECGLHGTSLATALEQGSPTVLVISTPKYCQTAICGPVLDVALDAKEAVGREDITFIHVEVFTDAGNTPTDLVTELGLPSEPWTFLIGADGALTDRFDGPIVPEFLREAVEAL